MAKGLRWAEWWNQAYLDAFRISKEAEQLRTFLQNVAPRCADSFSEYVPLPRMYRCCDPLFDYYSKVRTVYFGAGMTAEQKSQVENSPHVRIFTVSSAYCTIGLDWQLMIHL